MQLHRTTTRTTKHYYDDKYDIHLFIHHNLRNSLYSQDKSDYEVEYSRDNEAFNSSDFKTKSEVMSYHNQLVALNLLVTQERSKELQEQKYRAIDLIHSRRK